MRYRFLRFPGGKMKAVTLSYDDGIRQDIRLAQLLSEHNMKGTFNINSSALSAANPRKLTAEEIKEHILDKGHEVAVHGKHHIAPGIAQSEIAIRDVLDCREELECAFDMIIRGMAYPDSGIVRLHTGTDYAEIRSYLKSLGILYSRSLSADNNSFMLPTDFYNWIPTAKHTNKELFKWVDEFLALDASKLYLTSTYPRLFYLWGHSYEFDNDDNWDVIETFCEKISNKDDIWYATNIEICEYVEAYTRLVTSANGTTVYNPTLTEIFFTVDGKPYSVKPGETVKIQ